MLGLSPKNLEKLMKNLGMQQKQIDAEEVIIKKRNSEIRIENPAVTLIEVAGQQIFQISGNIVEKPKALEGEISISEADIKLVMEKAQVDYEKAKNALLETKDLAEAILKLQSEKT